MTSVLDKPTVDTTTLNETWLEDEPGCQIKHLNPANCTQEVTNRILCGCRGRSFLMCACAARNKQAEIDSGNKCAGCKRAAGDCWTVLPA
jgi:hypothetical protein